MKQLSDIASMSNIPTARIRELSNRYRKLLGTIERATNELNSIKQEIHDICGFGSHGPVTIYSVGDTQVSGYTRRAYTAIRTNNTSR